ncbi:MAG: CHAD domain-containing protein [Microcoleus sp. PH2017_10_PVI_O_A]|uniref:CHAD domain-containing protein n=1 Tax=unclassified Microcoleus TaxID=2642155 RepID=UPI001D9A9B11|nr:MULTISPECIES: CHAD domain-containing protein [unclassified Microcoleus]TAE77073.1 MAG: CHAD domain-containing protein [Oscillatoriales cyanobacterium]MCC3404562.1 CHAD domain-containing protein [Microcoleus sp. PH2017_10_PVI_O_A]MCC3463352.1 CHAD domain-containing protein [Microcoleus sp. PH2017_11_PCY_U_A]MCC3476880.1 CHAD domain-containing protein [Microcoleus sp. PH2017_12_PCY_D_A]MCC3527020.1 CHAD domain-containing protein [Microcoleus sp. PH2017_21_RUC_O_A]
MNVKTSAKVKTQVKTLGDAASGAIEKYYRKTVEHEDEVLKDKDAEELHQMRVGMRRLRSAVTGFAPVLDLPKAASERKIGKVGRILGTLRDLDVMLESLQNRYYPNLPADEQEVLDEALLSLLKQRRRALKRVRAVLEHKSYQSLKESIENWIEKPQFRAIEHLPIAEVLPDLLLPQVSEFFLHPAWLLGTEYEDGKVKVSDDLNESAVEEKLAAEGTILHDLRKQAKRVRYLMNLFGDFYGPAYEAYVEDVKAVQECLGDIQDSEVLGEFLTDFVDRDLQKELPKLAGLLAQKRYGAWQKWQVLQRKYLKSEIRQDLRSTLIHPAVDDAAKVHSPHPN